MRTILVSFILSAVLFAHGSPAQVSAPSSVATPNAQKAQAIVQKMIAALGGEAYLNLQDEQAEGRIAGFYNGEPTGANLLFWSFSKWPDKERVELTKQRDWVIIRNGQQGWEVTFRGAKPEDPKDLGRYLRNRDHSLGNVLRVWLKQPNVSYFYDGESFVGPNPVHQITIMNAPNHGVTLYIDANTFLPRKKTWSYRDPQTRDLDQEGELYDNWKPQQGIQTAYSTVSTENGEMVSQRFLRKVTYNVGLPDSIFVPRAGK